MTDVVELRAEFDKYDANNDGHIDQGEFASLVESLGVDFSAVETTAAFFAIDVNANGRIEFGEFCAWWLQYQAGS